VVARQQSHRAFENLYVQRFWTILDEFSDTATLSQDLTEWSNSDRAVAVNYIRLCEDQLDMRRLGRVTHDTWEFWSSAIRGAMSQPAYVALRETEPEKFVELRKFVDTGEDPFSGNRFLAWLGGL
jgi:hypothetical protein